MKFDIVIGNPPYTMGGAENGKGSKSAIPAFLYKAMEVGNAVYFTIPAHFATKHSTSMKVKKWVNLRNAMELFGLKDIQAIDQKKFFPDVEFRNASITILERGATRRVEEFVDRFGGFSAPEGTDGVERISTQRGHSIGKDSPELGDVGVMRIVTSVSNDGSGVINIKHIGRRVTPIKSPWCVCIQEQSGLGIRDAIILDNTAGDVAVTANVYPLHCNTRDEAEQLSIWVKSPRFNELMLQANGGNRLHRVFTLQLLPKQQTFMESVGVNTIFADNESEALTKLQELDMKFDVVLGNPPYNKPKDDTNNSNGSTLYEDFIETMAPNCDLSVFVTPAGWAAKKDTLASFKDCGLETVIFKSRDLFESVYVRSGYTVTVFKKKFQGDITVITQEGVDYKVNRSEPIYNSDHEYTQIDKLIKQFPTLKGLVKAGKYPTPKGVKGIITRLPQAVNDYQTIDPTLDTPNRTMLWVNGNANAIYMHTAKLEESSLVNKLIFSKATDLFSLGVIKFSPIGEGLSNRVWYLPVNSYEQYEEYKAYLESDFVKYILKNRKTNDVCTSGQNSFNHIPTLTSYKLLKEKYPNHIL